MKKCKYRPNIDDRPILYDRGGKSGIVYPDLEAGCEFWNLVHVPAGGVMALACDSRGHEFNSWPSRC